MSDSVETLNPPTPDPAAAVETRKPTLILGADHGGYELKNAIADWLRDKGYDVTDVGTNSADSVDYPDFAHGVSCAVADGDSDLGILVCTTGIGVSIAANRHRGVRAALVFEEHAAKMTRSHNDANVLCFAGAITAPETAISIVDTWLNTEFEGGRHQRRVDKLS